MKFQKAGRGNPLRTNIPELHAAFTARYKDFVQICCRMKNGDRCEPWIKLYRGFKNFFPIISA